jgi:hypothetical protein
MLASLLSDAMAEGGDSWWLRRRDEARLVSLIGADVRIAMRRIYRIFVVVVVGGILPESRLAQNFNLNSVYYYSN